LCAHSITSSSSFRDFAKFDSSQSREQYIDELNRFDPYIALLRSLIGFLQNPHLKNPPNPFSNGMAGIGRF
jgi:hypothetical protein